MHAFLEDLRIQRWDDHRYYHHSTVNQALHLISACSFLVAYVLLFSHPAAAALLAWLGAMVSRQVGHFFFEPKGYDVMNQATHAHKEAIKVGYNLRRKVVLMSIWAASPLLVYLDPTFFGAIEPMPGWKGFVESVGLVWLAIGIGALLFRTVQLAFVKDFRTGVVWCTKILTDPFHDIRLYYKAPLHLLRGEWFDPESPHAQA
ncbi:MAG: hypothetical protein JSR18_09720 [Proteobacteria bacterium]|nr:hypothetical protein [Pseudomonadota bacterium]